MPCTRPSAVRSGSGLRSNTSKNVPDKDQVATKTVDGPYSFFSVNCKDDCPEPNATPPRQFWQPKYELRLKFEDSKFKSQIVRETPLRHAAANMNKIFQSMLQNTVWKNYMLVNTQWPSVFGCTSLHSQSFNALDPKTDFLKQPDMTCSPAPTFMANSTLETYSQGDIPQASSSCIGCHGNAVGFQKRPVEEKPGKSISISRISPSCWRRRNRRSFPQERERLRFARAGQTMKLTSHSRRLDTAGATLLAAGRRGVAPRGSCRYGGHDRGGDGRRLRLRLMRMDPIRLRHRT